MSSTHEGWYELACEVEISDPEEAQEAYERAIALDPNHADAHVNLGRLLHEQKAPAAAEKHYRAALNADPEHDTAAFNLGVALEDLGRMREATEAYELALALDPGECGCALQPCRSLRAPWRQGRRAPASQSLPRVEEVD